MSSKSDDSIPVDNSLTLLHRLGCPTPQRGEGTALFPQDSNGISLPTPDLVAGDFVGAGHPLNFYIDVVAPTGQYMTLEKAQAAATAGFVNERIDKRGLFGIDELPLDYAKPLASSVVAKAQKYAGGTRAGSPLFGLIAYFCERGEYVGARLSSMNYLRALDHEFGDVPHGQLQSVLLSGHPGRFVTAQVAWDLPLSFVIYANRLRDDSFACAMLVNRHPGRRCSVSDNRVVRWMDTLARVAEQRLGKGTAPETRLVRAMMPKRPSQLRSEFCRFFNAQGCRQHRRRSKGSGAVHFSGDHRTVIKLVTLGVRHLESVSEHGKPDYGESFEAVFGSASALAQDERFINAEAEDFAAEQAEAARIRAQRLRPVLARLLSSADRAISKATMTRRYPSGSGLIMVALDFHVTVDPDTISKIIAEILLHRKLTAASGYIVCTPNSGMWIKETDRFHPICLPNTADCCPTIVAELCHSLGRAWRAFADQGGHAHG